MAKKSLLVVTALAVVRTQAFMGCGSGALGIRAIREEDLDFSRHPGHYKCCLKGVILTRSFIRRRRNVQDL